MSAEKTLIEDRACRRCGKAMPIKWGSKGALPSKSVLAYTCVDCLTPAEIADQTSKLKQMFVSGGPR